MTLRLKRIYEPVENGDGQRILVDRLWPRGIRKDEARLDHWAKDVAPSDDLRHWFGHDPEKWKEFHRRYEAELAENREAVDDLVRRIGEGDATLLFAAADTEHNNAVVLRDVLAGWKRS